MKYKKIKKPSQWHIGSLKVLLSLEICLGIGIFIHLLNSTWQIFMLTATLSICILFLFILDVIPYKVLKFSTIIIPTLCIITLLAIFVSWKIMKKDTVYTETDNGKASLFKNKNVMIIEPHEDDDINMLGGVIEQYVKYGSNVHVVFMTNGDYLGLGKIRLHEALNVMNYYGIPSENVIFLGYGDQWKSKYNHIYNSPGNVILKSHIGSTRTYGITKHPSYNNGEMYTRDNICNDIQQVIEQYLPDVIYCVDYDQHADHRATSLFFEESLNKVLINNEDYHPLVFKGFAYSTAWNAENDYYSLNMHSTKKPYNTPYMQENNIYNWQDRVRIPVMASSLSRFLTNSTQYIALSKYESQNAVRNATGIINADRVFWKRDTSSLLYTANITSSSSDPSKLNNFKLCDSTNVTNRTLSPFFDIWTPEETDNDKSLSIELKNKSDIHSICLYDNPSTDDNILNAVIEFDNGDRYFTGPLSTNGSATEIKVNEQNVIHFTVKILEYEGDNYGLSEIEAYNNKIDYGIKYIKIKNDIDDFIYDYYIDESGYEEFTLYTYDCDKSLNNDNYTISSDNDNCKAEIKNNKICVTCPKNESMTLKITDKENDISDSVKISNPTSIFTRKIAQKTDEYYSCTCRPTAQYGYYQKLIYNIITLFR